MTFQCSAARAAAKQSLLLSLCLSVSAGSATANVLNLIFPAVLVKKQTAQERRWRTPQLIESDNTGDAWYPQIAFDGAGNALAVWRQSDGNRYNIWANRYVAGSGWQTAQLIETDNAGEAGFPEIVFDGAGNAIAVWDQNDGTRYNIWANRYVAGSGWQTAQLIETNDLGSALTPQVACDGAGNAIAVWHQSQHDENGNGLVSVFANSYVAGSGWQTAQLIETDNTYSMVAPQVAFDGAGNAIAVGHQDVGSHSNIWANRYDVTTGWETAQLIETDNAGHAYSSQIAFDGAGNAIAVWQQSDGTRFNIWANRYVAGSGWQTAQLIETTNAGDAESPQIAFDGAGNAIAVWQEYESTYDTPMDIWANRYDATTGSWETAQLIETDNAGEAVSPQIVFDSKGNAIAVWRQTDGTRSNILANRYVTGKGWETAQLIETDNADNALSPQIAFDSKDNAIAVWGQNDGIRYNILAARFE